MDVSSFYQRPAQQQAARATRDQVRFDLAWQEWVHGLTVIQRLPLARR